MKKGEVPVTALFTGHGAVPPPRGSRTSAIPPHREPEPFVPVAYTGERLAPVQAHPAGHAPRPRPQHLSRRGDEVLPALSRLSLGTRCGVVFLVWGLTVAASAVVDAGSRVHEVAVTVHVLSLVLAFGAVMMVDWHGLLWMLGRRSLPESSRLAAAASPLIWLGIGGLLGSGALLEPDLRNPLTLLKIGLVLVVALNGATLTTVRTALGERPDDETWRTLPAPLRRGVVLLNVVSQLGWWSVILIGFLTAAQRG